ncbi:hypothetical protein SISNIDRAFT_490416 [Sistotremastrum niveocremeum HHB9708]|uniref:Uncharacterized protein n=2 Tax=Sistotremastraceae TaxID=3402574 RepID=A0A164NUT1_9AGAM|nr:hypothetical protein SISNIDRAFT_490416 [Sistotremastrum niveocremeum HHB9708]KZT40513.1 hypothetical protein SISSUDRAFT_1060280 [Sistotremastrum suecicum HHB10207 ss-3]
MASTTSTTPSARSRSNSTHAYAIVTTSTALLTRSNSTNVKLPQHHYTPISPGKERHPPIPRRTDYYRRSAHRHTKSLSSVYRAPPSLPPPPPSPLTESISKSSQLSTGTSEDDINLALGKNVIRSRPGFRRAETLPSFSSTASGLKPVIKLPDNPYSWTHLDLSSYLTSQGHPVLSRHIVTHEISGRALLALSPSSLPSNLTDVLSSDVIEGLLEEARKLRLSALKSRIWGLEVTQTKREEADENSGIAYDPESPTKRGRVRDVVDSIEKKTFETPRSNRSSISSITDVDENTVTVKRKPLQPVNAAIAPPVFISSERRASLPGSDDGSQSSSFSDSEGETTDVESPDLFGTPFFAFDDAKVHPPLLDDILGDESEEPVKSHSVGVKTWQDDALLLTAHRIPFTPAKDKDDDHPTRDASAGLRQPSKQMQDTAIQFDGMDCGLKSQTQTPLLYKRDFSCQTDDVPVFSPSPSIEIRSLKQRILELERKLDEVEAAPIRSSSQPADPVRALSDLTSLGISRYLMLAGLGICAIVTQAAIKKIARRT